VKLNRKHSDYRHTNPLQRHSYWWLPR